MLGLLFLLFLAAPVVDLYLLYRLGQAWGFLPAAGLALGTAAAGLAIGRARSARVFRDLRQDMSRGPAAGAAPGRGTLDALAVLVGAALLIAPGPMGDALGLALVLPPTRRLILALGRTSLERAVASGAMRVSVLRWQPGARPSPEEEAPYGLDPSKEIRLPPPDGGI